MAVNNNVSFQSPENAMDFEGLERFLEELDQERADLRKKEELMGLLFDQHSQIIKESEKELETLEDHLKSQAKLLVKIDTKRKGIEDEMKALKSALEASASRIEDLKKILMEGLNRLKNMKADFRREEIKRHIKTLRLIHECKSDLVDIEERILANDNEMEVERVNYGKAARTVRNAVEERTNTIFKIEECEKKIADCQIRNKNGSKVAEVQFPDLSNPTLAYLQTGSGEVEASGTSHLEIQDIMSEFQNLIAEELWRFHKAPVGPLYKFVHVKKKKWGALAERILRPHLYTYIVDSAFDQHALEQMISRFFDKFSKNLLDSGIPKPTCITIEYNSQFQPQEIGANFIQGMLTCDYIELMDALQFQENGTANVWKIFVGDVLNGQKILLFASEHDAFVVMHCQARESLNNPKVIMGYSLDGYEIHPFPNFRTVVIKVAENTVFMSVSSDDVITELQQKLIAHRIQLKEFQPVIEAHRKDQFGALEKFEAYKELSHKYSTEKADLDQRLVRLNAALIGNFSIEGETRKTDNLAAKITFLKLENAKMKALLEKKASRLAKKSLTYEKENEVLQKLIKEFEIKKDDYEENMLCMEMESNVVEIQIKMHRTTIAKMEKSVDDQNKVDLNQNDPMEKNRNLAVLIELESDEDSELVVVD